LARNFRIGLPGQRALDVGTGTGQAAATLARRGCIVTGLDPSTELLTAACRLAASNGICINFVQGVAESIGLVSHHFDVVTAALCWQWFDGIRAASEIRRVLIPGGRLAILQCAWLRRPGNIVEATEAILERHRKVNPGSRVAKTVAKRAVRLVRPDVLDDRGAGLHPGRVAALDTAGFVNVETFSFDVPLSFDHESWRGRVRTHGFAGASQSSSRVARLDAELEEVLREKFPDQPVSVPHRVFVVVGEAP